MSAAVSQSGRLRIFLCHSSGDKPAVRDLYRRLRADGFEPWLDEEDLVPGQKWQMEIPKAVHDADVVLVCLSQQSINKSGYVQKEIKFALDAADEKPEGTIFLIPVKLAECTIPQRLSEWHWVNLFEEKGYSKLLNALRVGSGSVAADTKAVVQPLSQSLKDFLQSQPSFLTNAPVPPAKASGPFPPERFTLDEDLKSEKNQFPWLKPPPTRLGEILGKKKIDSAWPIRPLSPERWAELGVPKSTIAGGKNLFPLYGVTLGKTTVREIASLGSRTTTIR